METVQAPVKGDVENIKGGSNTLKSAQEDLTSRVQALESGVKVDEAEGWKSEYVDIIGFYEFAKKRTRASQGNWQQRWWRSSRAFWMPRLSSVLHVVCDIQLRATKNYSVRVPITPVFLQEVQLE